MDSINEKTEGPESLNLPPGKPIGRMVDADGKVTWKKSDWRALQARIQSVFYKILSEEKRLPTQKEIAQRVGVSEATIVSHYKHFDFETLLDDVKQFTESVLQATAQSAITGNSRDRRLFFEVVHKFRKGFDVNVRQVEELSSDERKDEIRMLITELMAEDATFKDRLAGLLSDAEIAPPVTQ